MKLKSEVDWGYLKEKGDNSMYLHEKVQEKMEQKMREVEVLMKDAGRYMVASLVFAGIMLFGMVTDLYILWIGGMLGVMFMWYFGNKVHNQITRNMGFVDGIFYTTIETDKDFQVFREKLEKNPVGDKLRELVKEVKED